MENLDGIARHQLHVRNLNWDNLFVNPLMPTASHNSQIILGLAS